MDKRRKALRRQLMIGVSLVGALLTVFSGLLVRRLMTSSIDEAVEMAAAPPATLVAPEAIPVAVDPAVPGPAGDAPPDAVAAADEPRNPFRRREAVAAAAYESAEDQPAGSGRRRPFLRGQGGESGDAAPPADGANPSGPGASLPPGADAPPSADAAAAFAPVGADPNAGQAPDPSVQPSSAAPPDAGPPVNPQPMNSPMPFAAASPGSDPNANDPAPAASAPGFIDPNAVQAVGRELPSDARFGRRDRFRDSGAAIDDPNAANGNQAPPGAYNGPASGAPSAYNAPPAYGGQAPYGGQPAAYDNSPAAPPGEAGKYVVQPNDNYWTISEKVYGGGAFFKALERFNEGDRPQSHRLQVGDVVQTPATSVLRQRWPDLCPKPRREQVASQIQPVTAAARQRMGAPIYIVEQGDSLFDIARHRLGKASRWVEIYDLNRDVLGDDFDYLKPGTELVMPSDRRQSQDTITRQPGDNLQR